MDRPSKQEEDQEIADTMALTEMEAPTKRDIIEFEKAEPQMIPSHVYNFPIHRSVRKALVQAKWQRMFLPIDDMEFPSYGKGYSRIRRAVESVV